MVIQDNKTIGYKWLNCSNRARSKKQGNLFVPARPEECEEIYRWLYDNLDIMGKDEDAQDKAVLIIKQGIG